MSTEPIVYTTSIWSKAFWQGASERAIKTFAQAFIAVFGVNTSVEIVEVTENTLTTDTWLLALVSGAAAAALSVVMSIASPGFTAGETALAAGAVPYAPLPEAAVVPDGTGEHRAVVEYEEPAVDSDGYLVVDDGPAPAGSTAVDDAPIVIETTVKAEEY